MATLSTVAAFGFDDFDPPETLALYRRLGCTSSQFYRNEANPPAVADARRIAEDAGLPFDSIHGVFGGAYDPSSPDEPTRRDAVDVYRREGELAAELGGPMVVVHPAPMVPPGVEPRSGDRRKRLDALRRSIADLARAGEQLGVVYLWENITDLYWVGNDPLVVADLLREADSPHARMCFDTGHALMTGTVEDRLARCADVVRYLHVHDNDGKEDTHLMPGDGAIDWPALRRTLRSSGIAVPAMLEVFYLADDLRACIKRDLPAKLADWLDLDAPAARNPLTRR